MRHLVSILTTYVFSADLSTKLQVVIPPFPQFLFDDLFQRSFPVDLIPQFSQKSSIIVKFYVKLSHSVDLLPGFSFRFQTAFELCANQLKTAISK
jgi:hypothetical protein